ncbi:hypothetical protein QAD02_001048, partial [Eretmocerus hayati]
MDELKQIMKNHLKDMVTYQNVMVELFDLWKSKIEEESLSNKIEEHHIIYTLPHCNVDGLELAWRIDTSTITLMGLANFSSIFGRSYDFNEIEELMNNDSAVFAGAILLKLFIVMNAKCCSFPLVDPCEEAERGSSSPDESDHIGPILSFKSFGFLTTTTCCPNVKSYLTLNNRYIMYSLHPIKKGSPLSTSLKSVYDEVPKLKRQTRFKNMYGRMCDCQACVENWSEICAKEDVFKFVFGGESEIDCELMKELRSLLDEVDAKIHKLNFPDAKFLTRSKQLVARSWKHFPMPSVIAFRAITLLIFLLGTFLSPRNADVLRIPSYECKKGLLPNGEWKGFHIIYAREYRRLEDSKFQHYMKLSFLALMGLAKFSSLFEAKYDMNQIDKLIADESAMFAGTLLLKLCLLTCCRNTTVIAANPFQEPEPQNIIKRNMASQDEDSLSVKSIGYLPRFGCVPNAFTYFTEGTRFVTHCITPIKKGSP